MSQNSVCGFHSSGVYYVVYSESVFPIVVGKKFVRDYLSKGPDFWRKYINLFDMKNMTSKPVFYNNTLEDHFLKEHLTVTTSTPQTTIFIMVDLDRNMFIYKYDGQIKISCGLNNVHAFIFDHVNEHSYRLE